MRVGMALVGSENARIAARPAIGSAELLTLELLVTRSAERERLRCVTASVQELLIGSLSCRDKCVVRDQPLPE